MALERGAQLTAAAVIRRPCQLGLELRDLAAQPVEFAAGVVPPGNAATWEVLAPFADDVRVLSGSTYDGYGLQPGL